MKDSRYARVMWKSEALRRQLIATRRDFYMHPELSGEEERTSRVVAERLRALGLAVQARVGGYGVVATLRGARPGPVIAYRADMDALPVQDALKTSYRSPTPGVKHACGHDVHTTIALGVAEVLTSMRDELAGTVKFIFQPAEESLDGARAMIADGVLDAPRPEMIFALHTFPIPVGTVGIAQASCLAGMEEFRARFYSPAGDLAGLVARSATALRALSTGAPPSTPEAYAALVRRMRAGDVFDETVFVSCWPAAGGPSQGHHLLGLVSVPRAAYFAVVRARIRQTLDTVTAEVGATYDLAYTFSNPPLVNDAAVVRAVTPVVEAIVGTDRTWTFRAPYPFAHEDFALFLDHLPGALLWLGTANRERGVASLPHTPDFDVDEAALVVGVRVMAAILLRCKEIYRRGAGVQRREE